MKQVQQATSLEITFTPQEINNLQLLNQMIGPMPDTRIPELISNMLIRIDSRLFSALLEGSWDPIPIPSNSKTRFTVG